MQSAQTLLARHANADMDSANGTEITVFLRAWSDGDHRAFESLIPLVYKKLYSAAQWYMAQQGPGHILQNTALVNETYLRLEKLDGLDWQDRGHFYAVCAQLMRRILSSYSRAQLSLKRGGTIQHVELDESIAFELGGPISLITLDDALHDLAAYDERMLRIVELRVLVGLEHGGDSRSPEHLREDREARVADGESLAVVTYMSHGCWSVSAARPAPLPLWITPISASFTK
jgi:RNA polymerase sigma factor (TIGR02999 family)